MRDELEKEGRKKQARSNKRTCPSSALRVVCDMPMMGDSNASTYADVAADRTGCIAQAVWDIMQAVH